MSHKLNIPGSKCTCLFGTIDTSVLAYKLYHALHSSRISTPNKINLFGPSNFYRSKFMRQLHIIGYPC